MINFLRLWGSLGTEVLMGDAVGRSSFGKLLGSSLKGLSSITSSLKKTASDSAARVAKAASNFSSRGSTMRALPIDEGDEGWRSRSGRSSGAATYEGGDLCRSLFRRALAMSPRDREKLYGGTVLLVGVVSAEGLPSTSLSDVYVGLSVSDTAGRDFPAEHALTHTVSAAKAGTNASPLVSAASALMSASTETETKTETETETETPRQTTTPKPLASLSPALPFWDEVFPVGLRLNDFDSAITLRLSVKTYAGPLARAAKVGVAKFHIPDFNETADAMGVGTWALVDAPLLNDKGDKIPGASLRLMFLLHRALPLPRPTSMGACVVAALGLVGTDGEPQAVSFVSLSLTARDGEPIHEGHSGTGGRSKALRSATVAGPSPAHNFNECFEFHDVTFGGVPSEIAGGLPGPWGWAEGIPNNFMSLPTQSVSCDLAAATQLSVSALEVGRIGDAPCSELLVSLANLWGHEDAVVCGSTLRICRWWRLKRVSASGSGSGSGSAGAGAMAAATARATVKPPRIFLDIVLRFETPLLPEDWVEAVCAVSGDTYFYNTETHLAQWEAPDWPAEAAPIGSPTSGRDARFESFRCRARTATFLSSGGKGSRSNSLFLDEDVDSAFYMSTATLDVVPGDAPHKPPRPRAPHPLSAATAAAVSGERVNADETPEDEKHPERGGRGGAMAAATATATTTTTTTTTTTPTLLPKPVRPSPAAKKGALAVSAPPPPPASTPPALALPLPPPPPSPSPAPLPVLAAAAADFNEEEDESLPVGADLSTADLGSGAASRAAAALTSVPTFSNPLSGLARGASGASSATIVDREAAFFAAMQKMAAAKRETDEAVTKVSAKKKVKREA